MLITRAKQRLATVLLGSRPDSLNRRTAAFLFDRGLSAQPTELAKRRQLLRLLQDRGHRTFLESGTYRGDTVAFLCPYARAIISVELDEQLYAAAVARFAGISSVEIRHGDAAVQIPRALKEARDPPLVYLDGHFSGPGTALGDVVDPAPEILVALAPHAPAGTTIVVDDLRLFGTQPEYPGLDDLVLAASRSFPGGAVRVGLDSLVIEL